MVVPGDSLSLHFVRREFFVVWDGIGFDKQPVHVCEQIVREKQLFASLFLALLQDFRKPRVILKVHFKGAFHTADARLRVSLL